MRFLSKMWAQNPTKAIKLYSMPILLASGYKYNYITNSRNKKIACASVSHGKMHTLQLHKYFFRELFLLPGYKYNYMNDSPVTDSSN